jgi:hypothetical protein
LAVSTQDGVLEIEAEALFANGALSRAPDAIAEALACVHCRPTISVQHRLQILSALTTTIEASVLK